MIKNNAGVDNENYEDYLRGGEKILVQIKDYKPEGSHGILKYEKIVLSHRNRHGHHRVGLDRPPLQMEQSEAPVEYGHQEDKNYQERKHRMAAISVITAILVKLPAVFFPPSFHKIFERRKGMPCPPVATAFSFIEKRSCFFHAVVTLLSFIIISNFSISMAAEQETSAARCTEYDDAAYRQVAAILDSEHSELSYDDLQKVYNLIVAAEYCLPKLDEIITQLMGKRNPHPRVDQMILIYSARIIGSTTRRIDHVAAIFEKLIANDRTNLWVMSSVAEALGDYFIDLEEGERLASLVEKKINMLAAREAEQKEEFYGYHFQPPPKTEMIKSMIAGTEPRKKREISRIYYYNLRLNYSEEQIVSFLNYLDKKGLLAKRRDGAAFKYLFNHLEDVLDGMTVKESNKTE